MPYPRVSTGYPKTQGRKTVAAAGTPEPVSATSQSCSYILAQALLPNTNPVTVGLAGVNGTAAARTGIALAAGDQCLFPCNDLKDVFVDAITNGEGISFVAFE